MKYTRTFENDLEYEGTVIGKQTQVVTQDLTEEGYKFVEKNLLDQKASIEAQITAAEDKVKGLPKITERRKDNLKTFMKNLEDARVLAAQEKSEEEVKGLKDSLKRLEKDLNELYNSTEE